MRSGAMNQPAWMAFAWSELGQREIAGPRSNPRIVDFIRRSGHPEAANDATAWCAAFVGACLDRAGISGTGSLLARSYLQWGAAVERPEPGTIAVLSRGADPTFGHVGFLVGMTDDTVLLLGGNQADSVSVAAFPRRRLLGLRMPAASADERAAEATPPRAKELAATQFDWSLARILVFEGGYTDDPFDPGGPTNKGITLGDFARHRGDTITAANRETLIGALRRIGDDEVGEIYLRRYWRRARCPLLPAAIAHFHFDAAVNQGVGGATRMLQQALGVAIDGDIGPLTLGAATTQPLRKTLEAYAEIRRRRYRGLHHFWRFGRGWLARVDKAFSQAVELMERPERVRAEGQLEAPRLDPSERYNPNEKGPNMPDTTMRLPGGDRGAPHAPALPGKWWGSSLTVWGALLTAATTVAPTVFAAFGFDVPVDLVRKLGVDVVAVFQALAGLAGTIMTIAGRARASTRLERRAVALKL